MRPVDVDGHVLHQVGLPYHWGSRGLTTGGSANDLTHVALDPNTHIQEKVSTCDIRAGRRPSGDDLRRELDELAGKGVAHRLREPVPRPFGEKEDGRAWKCTLCYDRPKDGHEPACAKACPTDSIQFGPLDELRERAGKRLAELEAEGWNGAQLYGHDERDGVGGMGAFFLLLDDPEVYGLPPDPVVTTKHVPGMWAAAAAAMAVVGAGMAALFGGGR
jgi:hypothetical protein